MSELIDARGLGCGQPIILAKEAFEMYREITILVDELPALENLKVLGKHTGCVVEITEKAPRNFLVNMKR